MQAAPQAQQAPLGVIYDSSLDGGIDQLLALSAIYHFSGTRRIRIAALSTSRFNLNSAGFLDAVARFNSGSVDPSLYGPSRGMMPIGMAASGEETDDVSPMLVAPLTRLGAEAKPLYPHFITQVNQAALAPALIHNAIQAYADGNAAIIMAGSPRNLVDMLKIRGSAEWAERKVRTLAIAAGRFGPGAVDPTVRANVAGFRTLLANWPGLIVMAGAELNEAVPFPGARLADVASWAVDHPVVDAYIASRPMPWDGPTQTLAAALHAVMPEENFFTLSDPGTITVADDGRTQFQASPDGKHRILSVAADQKERIVEKYIELVTTEGVAPLPTGAPSRPGALNDGRYSPESGNPAVASVAGKRTVVAGAIAGVAKDWTKGLTSLVAAVTLGGCSLFGGNSAPESLDMASLQADFETHVQPILTETCAQCHSGSSPAANLDVTRLTSAESLLEQRVVWEKIVTRVRAGEMPPPGIYIEPKALSAMVGYIDRTFALHDASMAPDPGRMVAHRLNRVEYANTVRDLLGIEFRADRDFPADDSGHGFDTIGELLNISPLLMDRYMSAAERIAQWALSTELPDKPLEIDYRLRDQKLERLGRSAVELNHQVDFAGEYTVRFELPGERPTVDGVTAAPVTLGFWMDGELIATKLIETKPSGLVYFNPYSEEEIKIVLPPGDHVFRAGFIDDEFVKTLPEADVFRNNRNKYIEGVVFLGPFPSAEERESRKRILTCDPASGTACVQKIIGELATKAYRRPVTEREVNQLVNFVDMAQQNGQTAEEGVQLALQAILMSPNFLFRIERDPNPLDPSDIHEVSEFELASRLSYFLWSSMPDQELFDLAAAGKLSEPRQLERQVNRMMADPRSLAFAQNFAGQWLETRNLDQMRPDPDLFEDWDLELREAMKLETAMFFQYVLAENRSIRDFLDADYTFLNERLATHYDLEGVPGPDFRRVLLGTDRRGGILTHGAVLTVSSYPTRTSPVIRGKYVLENILGSPPPPPPPDVPALEASATDAVLSMREQLSRHRADPICSSCHSKMDPLGFGLENYDAIGRWRDTEIDSGPPIDVSGNLPDGKQFQTSAEMRALLTSQLPAFSRTLSERMMTYALRRGLEVYDRPALERVQREVARDGYKFQTMVHEIVKSLPFQARRGEEQLANSN